MTKAKKDDNLTEETPKKKRTRKKSSEKSTAEKKPAKKRTSRKKTDPSKKPARKRTSKKKTEAEEQLQLEIAVPEEPKQEEPIPEEQKQEEPFPEEPKQEEPVPEEPKQEEPVPEEPKQEEPVPEDTGTKVISADDYQPIVWVTEEEPSEEAPEETPSEEPSEKPEYDVDEILGNRPAPVHVDQSPRILRIFGIAFCAILIFMFVLNIIVRDKTYSDQENRVFQQFPKFSVGNYLAGRFESQLDNYANDQFAGRNLFIKIKSAADLSIGQLQANGVFKAKDSYLIEDIVYPDKKGSEADIEALKQFKKKYKGKKMYFMLVPNAANILKEKLPSGVTTRDQNKDMDKLFSEVKALGYKTIDVRNELRKAKKDIQVYYRTDHHWTTDAAYTAYMKAADVMKLKKSINYEPYVVKKDFKGTLYSKSGFTNGRNDAIKIYLPEDEKAVNSVIRYKDSKEKTTKYYVMENLDKKDAYTVFGGTNQSLFSISTPTKQNRNLLVIKDSYANCFIPFLTQSYRTITVVDPRYYYENIATVIKANDIDEVLFLYNANTFFSDNYMRMMLTNK